VAGVSFRKRITLNDVVGAFTDEFSFLYEASQDRLTTTGILFEADVSKQGTVRFAGGPRVDKTREFYQSIRSAFTIINPKQTMSEQIKFNSSSFKPTVFEGEELKVSILYNDKEIKTIYLPMASKEFHLKQIPQALVVPALFSGLRVSREVEGSFLVRITLEKVSPVRVVMKEFFGKLGQNLISENLSRNTAYSSGRRTVFNILETDTINFNGCDEAKFFRPRSVVTLGHLVCQDDLQLVVGYPLNAAAEYSIVPNRPTEAIVEGLDEESWHDRVHALRQLIFNLEDNVPLVINDYNMCKI
jgi:hypothetical protein